MDHRLASVTFLSTRLCIYALLPQDKEIKIQIISTVICNDHFNLYILDQVSHKDNKHSKKENNMNKNETNTSKRVYFTYVGKETKFIKELHKNSNVNMP